MDERNDAAVDAAERSPLSLDHLALVYGLVHRGLGNPDLQEAKALVEELR